MNCYIFDIDGTLANLDHRLSYIKSKPRNYKAFYAGVTHDAPIAPMCAVAKTLAVARTPILFCSGRPEETRPDTMRWLEDKVFSWLFRPNEYGDYGTARLYMRKSNDYRKDSIVKEELLDQILLDGFVPVMVFDDRPSVCEMWKRRGILVARVGDKDDF